MKRTYSQELELGVMNAFIGIFCSLSQKEPKIIHASPYITKTEYKKLGMTPPKHPENFLTDNWYRQSGIIVSFL